MEIMVSVGECRTSGQLIPFLFPYFLICPIRQAKIRFYFSCKRFIVAKINPKGGVKFLFLL